MIDWGSLQFERIWPLGLGLATAAALVAVWYFRKQSHFPDMALITGTVPASGLLDRLPAIAGGAILLLLTLIMMEPSLVRVEVEDLRARDFLVIVDTSRSMRHDTTVRRDSLDLNFRRRVGTFSTSVEDPETLPYLARFELARESLLSFLEQRRAQDRVGLIYFNDNSFTLSAPTSNIDFVMNQLAAMDDYVNWGTDIANAMNSGLNLIERYPGNNRKAVILLTDAEATYTKEVEQQLSRLASMGVSFYLLWITTDANDIENEEIIEFLDFARTVGTVVTIENLDSNNLGNALRDISTLEDYSYQEEKRQQLDLTRPATEILRYLLLAWLFLVVTIFHPGKGRTIFRGEVT